MLKKIKKYASIVSIIWQVQIEYRARMVMWFMVEILPILAMLFMWFGIYRYGEALAGFELKTLVSYYLMSHILAGLISVHFEEDAVDNVNAGRISQYFVRPFSFKKHLLLGEISWKSIGFFVTTIPMLVILGLFARNWFIMPTAVTIITMLPFLVLGFIIDSLLSYFVVIGAFFFEQAKALNHLKWVLVGLFSGSMLPLNVYPNWLRQIAEFLPFKFLRSVPINIYLQQLSGYELIKLFFSQLLWVFALWSMVQILWKRAEKKYTAVGN